MVAVAAGAFMAHGLPEDTDQRTLDLSRIALDYHFYNSVALMVIGFICRQIKDSNKMLELAGFSLSFGMIFFCGSLYLQILTDIAVPNILTPFGGLLLILGWAGLFLASLLQQEPD